MQYKTVDLILCACFRQQADKVCLILQGDSQQSDLPVTYRDLGRISAAYARAYRKAGIQPGEVVVLILEHGLDLIGAFWGAILYGAVPSILPYLTEKLHPDRYVQDLASLFSVTHPAAWVTSAAFSQEIEAKLSPDCLPRIRMTIQEVIPSEEPITNWIPGGERDDHEILFLQHSSGTTGLQKGVAITHHALLNQIENYSQAIDLSPEDVIVSWLPLYHDMGLIAGFILPILTGTPLVLMSPMDWVRAPYRLMQTVSRYKGTLTWLPNFAFNYCTLKIRDAQISEIDLSSWRAVINCSEPVYWKSMSMFANRFRPYGLRENALSVSYAMAENVFGVTQAKIDNPIRVEQIDAVLLQTEGLARPVSDQTVSHLDMVSCGYPIPGVEVCAVDLFGHNLPERHVGELAVRSNCMLAEYYHRQDATGQAIVDGWYLTGDLGYLADGEVFVTGRKKDLIITSGRNIFPQDIEAAVNEVKWIHGGRAVAFGVFNETLCTEDVALVAEMDEDQTENCQADTLQTIEDEVRLAVNRATGISLRYIRLVRPKWVIKTSSGKIARSANRDKFLFEMNQCDPTLISSPVYQSN